jgi:hypothetical protein
MPDHDGAKHDDAKDSVKQHAMLVLRRDREIAEDHRDHEYIVEGERLLDDPARQVELPGGPGSVCVGYLLDNLVVKRLRIAMVVQPPDTRNRPIPIARMVITTPMKASHTQTGMPKKGTNKNSVTGWPSRQTNSQPSEQPFPC